MTYSERLQDPRWQKKRLELLEAHGWQCEDCGRRDKSLQVHHCYYLMAFKDRPWDYDNDLLMVLCGDCHEFRQGREQAMHVELGRVMRGIGIAELEATAWDMIFDAIRKAGDARNKEHASTLSPTDNHRQ